MIRSISIVTLLCLLMASTAWAGLGSGIYSSRYSRESGTIVVAVKLKDEGLYNLIISAHFLRKPRDKKIYKSDGYEKLIDRLLVEWRGIALKKVLESKALEVSDFAELKNSIQTELDQLIAELKTKFLPGQNVEVVFALSDFFLLEPKDK